MLVLFIAGYVTHKHFAAGSALELLDKMRRIRPHATQGEVEQLLGPPDYVVPAGEGGPTMTRSAIGEAQHGTVLVYMIKRFHPKLLYIHLLPESGVQFVTWEPD